MPTEDRLLNVHEAAEVLGVSTDWIYRNKRWKELPFTVVLSKRKTMFSLQGILKYIEENLNGRKSMAEGKDIMDSLQLQGEGVSKVSDD